MLSVSVVRGARRPCIGRHVQTLGDRITDQDEQERLDKPQFPPVSVDETAKPWPLKQVLHVFSNLAAAKCLEEVSKPWIGGRS